MYSHSEEFEARGIYLQVENIMGLFKLFKENRNNKISMNKDAYLDHLNKHRLFVLEKMNREETIKQVINSIEC